ncbi:MAG: histidine kinase, partial [Flavobacteriales bacterium]|nr:histidine kinase [Flavobacteriales bacterium]
GLVVLTYFVLTGILLAVIAGPRAARSNWARNLALVLGALAVAPLTQYSEQFWPQRLAGFSPDPYPFVIYLFQFGWALPLWGLTQALLGYHFETMAQARAVTRAQALAYDAQLHMLHYQINPHFLFNTLNSVSSLVGKDPESARSMLGRLGHLLRVSLDGERQQKVGLAQEVEHVGSYLGIEAVRFRDRLSVTYDVPEELGGAMVPSMILQPLAENAIKHGLDAMGERVRISVTAVRADDALVLTVMDDGPGCADVQGALDRGGIGLRNVRERLRTLYGDRAIMHVTSPPTGGFRVDLTIPLEQDPAR